MIFIYSSMMDLYLILDEYYGNKFCLDNTYLFIQRWLEINSTMFRVISIYIWTIRLILVYFYD